MKRILVVGSTGLVGSALAREFVRMGAHVVGTRREACEVRGSLAAHEFIQVDLQRPDTFENISGEFDTAFMCAAVTSIARCQEFPKETSLVNITNSLQLLQRIARHSPRIVFLSSSAVFGSDAAEHTEVSATGTPRYEYGRQKAAVERVFLSSNDGATVVRISKVLCKTLPLLQKFFSELKNGQECRPFANLFMAPVSIRYVVNSLVKVEESGYGGVFHLSGSEVISYAQFLRSFAAHHGFSTGKVKDTVLNNAVIPSPLESKAYALLAMERTAELLNLNPQSLSSVLADL